jgi:outer membrane protein OmpA-like peptidoglycan-associated protein
MRTYRLSIGRAAWLLSAACAGLLAARPAEAQRKYLVELGVAPIYTGYDNLTDLGGSVGGLARLGIWLPARFEIEGEGSYAKPKTTTASIGVSVTTISGSVLYNVPLGATSFAHARLGIASTSYGTCPAVSVPGSGPCGSTSGVIGGAGVRIGLSPTLFVRADGVLSHSSAKVNALSSSGGDSSVGFSNVGVSVGLGVMLGSRRIVDSDKDGVLDSHDKCPNTPLGALVDKDGCPTDSDKDGVYDGLDRCPATPAGVKVDASGCPLDSDKDGVPDGLDRCPDTPAGAAVDANGCSKDSDGDGVPDGIDRCPDTPAGAAVDQLGCPGDADGDGVLDGLDRCPNTPPGTRVNAFGCPIGESGQQPPKPNIDSARAPGRPTPKLPSPDGAAAPSGPVVLSGVGFSPGTARLTAASRPVLDSVAKALLANPGQRVEVAVHTDPAGAPGALQHLSQLRAEAIRRYLISKQVPFQWITAKGYGGTEPVTSDTTAAGKAQNRRVEIRPAPAGQ